MKNKQRTIIYRWSFLILICFFSCIEEIEIKEENEFESILIIEATITNEQKHQEILLSRSFNLEEEGPLPELGAIVTLNGNGNSIEFAEEGNGVYRSIVEFEALPDVDYSLEIETLDNEVYASAVKKLAPESLIDEVRVERSFNENNQEGVSIFVDAINNTSQKRFYRYEYEETYKIVAPRYSPLELIILNDDFPYPQELLYEYPGVEALTDFFFEVRSREEQEQVCYNTVKSNTILISSTEELLESDSNTFRVRFLNRDMPEIIHRYSILVRQYTQSEEAHVFYKTLNAFSNSENVFSEVQTGFLEGNVFSKTNNEAKVIGFFEVTSFDEKRVYFNYDSLFPGETKPSYYVSCDDTLTPILLQEDFAHNITNSPVIDALKSGQVFFNFTEDTNLSPFAYSPFEMVLQECGDCTVYGDNSVPEFWIEE